jgi:hypothetical protein
MIAVHTELSALATLYLTYLHCRPKPGEASAQQQQSPVVAGEGPRMAADGHVSLREYNGQLGPSVAPGGSAAESDGSGGVARPRKVGLTAAAAAVMFRNAAKPGAGRSAAGGTGMSSRSCAEEPAPAPQSPPTLRSDKVQAGAPGSPLPRYMQSKGKR